MSYSRLIGLGCLVFPAIVLRGLGFEGIHLLYATLGSWIPVNVLALNLLKYVIPPKVELYLPKDSMKI